MKNAGAERNPSAGTREQTALALDRAGERAPSVPSGGAARL